MYISHVQELGYPVWILNQELNPSKLAPKSFKNIFVGYEDGPKAIKYYDSSTQSIQVSRKYHFPLCGLSNLEYPKAVSPAQLEGESSGSMADKLPSNPAQYMEDGANQRKRKYIPDEPTKKSAQQKVTHNYSQLNDPLLQLSEISDSDESDNDEVPVGMPNLSSANQVYLACNEADLGHKNPKTLSEAKRSPEWLEWEKAVQVELNQLEQMGTWEIVDPPEDRKPISNKWVFTKTFDKDGNLQKYKAQLVAQGFTQVPGMDYNETFSPVIRLEMIRAIIALAIAEDWEIQQMGVKGAYLNGKLKEEIFMTQSEGYSDGTSLLCWLIKTLYGLKQSGHKWNEELDTKLKGIDFKLSDVCVYI